MTALETMIASLPDGDVDGTVPLSGCTVRGRGRVHASRPAGFEQWVARARLRRGASIVWDDTHGDQAVIVVSGVVRVGDDECGPKGAVVVEAGASATLDVVDDAVLVLFGDHERDGGRTGSPVVHVVPPEGYGTFEDPSSSGGAATFYVDSTCSGCDVTLFRVWADGAYTGSPHSHSTDELIHVTEGVIWIDDQRLEAGTTIAIPADRQYTFRATDAFELVNYRRAASMMTRDPSRPAVRETRAVRS